MIILRESVTGDLASWFANITGALFIQGNPVTDTVEESPSPNGLYGMVNIVSITDIGLADEVRYENTGDDLTETVQGPRRILVSVNAYRNGAFDLMNSVKNKLQRTSSIEHFVSINLGYESTGEIRDLSQLSSGGLEERYQFDLGLHTVASDSEIVTAIEELSIIGTEGTGAVIMNSTLNNAE